MKFIFIFPFLFHIPPFLNSYNVDINSPYVKSIQFTNDSLFGFSINIFTDKLTKRKHILVGAPLHSINNLKIKSTGALYACPVSKEYMDCTQISNSEYSEGSLFGYVIDSNSVDGSIYTCAPRFLRTYVNVKFVEGACWEYNTMFQEVDQIINDDCLYSIKKNTQNYEFRNCLTGVSIKSLNNKQVLVTSPYSHEGRGTLINNIFNPQRNSRSSTYLNANNSMFKYQLAGYSMSVGTIYRDIGVKTVLLGTPGIFQYDIMREKIKFGQVMLVKLQDNSIVNAPAIFGEQFGGGFGYSVLAIDLNGDGYDEIVVGAPFSNNNNGNVFVYWNIEEMKLNDNKHLVPVDLTNRLLLGNMKKTDQGQFGLCLENIGDINKDSLMDLAVGAPFENDGSGTVYIYLGTKNQNLTLSQKIEGRTLSPDLRGFGFSIFGRNEDLDSNQFPDFVIGAVLSNHIVGLRSRPIMKVYPENMLSTPTFLLPYDFEDLAKCNHEGQQMPCIELHIAIYYYFPYLKDCSSHTESKEIDYEIELDHSFLKNSLTKRVYFENKENIMKGRYSSTCKWPNSKLTVSPQIINIIFPPNIFFNISVGIDVKLKWFINITDPPKRNLNGGEMADLDQYPVLEKSENELLNKIDFGMKCKLDTCNPFLTVHPTLSLPKDGEEFLLYIGNVSTFKLDIIIKNIAKEMEDRAYRTYIKLNYDSKHLIIGPSGSDRRLPTQTGFIYSVKNPLNPKQSENISFEFGLSNDFSQSAMQFIHINISVEAMVNQPHLIPINLKIKIKMVANINLKMQIVPDNYPYRESHILGFNGITSEEKIGPKMKLTITLSNNIQNSVVVSSKLLIYFPWETASNPRESDGQFLLYLLRTPKFHVSSGNRNISCDFQTLTSIINIINTRIYQTTSSNLKLEDVLLRNISLPPNKPTMPKLSEKLIFHSKEPESDSKTDWENIVLLDCLRGSARCVPIVCDVGPLSRQSGEITFEFDIRIWIHTLIENFLRYKFVYIDIPIYWIPLVNYDIVLKDPKENFKSIRVVAVNLQKPKPPPSLDIMYAIIIAVIIGLILLITIVIILYQCKFFRRQNIGNRKKKANV